jgi:hypothetical protein
MSGVGEEEVSPDGSLRIVYAVNEVHMSHWIRAPRVIRTSDEAVLVDLWSTSWDGTAIFSAREQNALFLTLRCYPGDTAGFTVRIDPLTSTFAFNDRLDRPEPLGAFRARLEERYLDQMIAKALEDTRARVKKRQKAARAILERLEALVAFRLGEGFLDDELALAPLFADSKKEGSAEDGSYEWLLERIDDALDGDEDDDE